MKTLSRHLRLGGIALVTAAMAVSLGACTTGNGGGTTTTPATGTSTTAPAEPVTLTLLSHYNAEPMGPQLQAYVDEWNKANPLIQIQMQPVEFNDLQTTLNVRQSGGRGADIVSSYSLWGGQLVANGVLAAPPADVAAAIKADYSQAAVDTVTGAGGQIFGYPTEFTPYVLFYNKQILAAAGFNKPPATWDELKTIANAVTKKDASGNYVVQGLSLTNQGDAPTAHPFLTLLDSIGGTFVDDKGASLLDDKAKQVMQFENDLVKSGASSLSVNTFATFPTGGTAMGIQASWWLGSLKAKLKDTFNDVVGTAPIPGQKAGDVGSLAYSFFMGVNANSPHQAEAWQFLTWLNGAQQADGTTRVGTWMAANGIIPPRKTDANVLGTQMIKDNPALQSVFDAASYAMAEANTPNASQAKVALDGALQGMMVNGVSVDDTYNTLVSDLGKQ